jgi:hypothetical protein
MGQQNPWAMALAIAVLVVIYYVSTRTKKKATGEERQGLSENELLVIMRQRARDAVKTAAADYGITLDHTPGSVPLVEGILDRLHQRHLETPFDKEALTQETTKWGAYLGEVSKKIRRAEWELDSGTAGPWSLPLVDALDHSETFPVAFCRDRILDGPGSPFPLPEPPGI